jgi:hypothetical protein
MFLLCSHALRTLSLRQKSAQGRIEGRTSTIDWKDDDFAVVDVRVIGRMYKNYTVQGGLISAAPVRQPPVALS